MGTNPATNRLDVVKIKGSFNFLVPISGSNYAISTIQISLDA